jgi:hypothetical protein
VRCHGPAAVTGTDNRVTRFLPHSASLLSPDSVMFRLT